MRSSRDKPPFGEASVIVADAFVDPGCPVALIVAGIARDYAARFGIVGHTNIDEAINGFTFNVFGITEGTAEDIWAYVDGIAKVFGGGCTGTWSAYTDPAYVETDGGERIYGPPDEAEVAELEARFGQSLEHQRLRHERDGMDLYKEAVESEEPDEN